MARTVLHADESFVNPETRNYLVVAITKDEAGYAVVSEWPTLEKAKSQAAAYNANLGLTEDEILGIRISSMLKAQVVESLPDLLEEKEKLEDLGEKIATVDQDSPGAREALAYAAGVDAGKEAGLREARAIVRASRSYKDSQLDVVHISDTLVDRADAVRDGNAIDWQAAGREAFKEGRPAAPGADKQILAAIGNNPDDHPETAWMMTEWTKGYNAARDEEI